VHRIGRDRKALPGFVRPVFPEPKGLRAPDVVEDRLDAGQLSSQRFQQPRGTLRLRVRARIDIELRLVRGPIDLQQWARAPVGREQPAAARVRQILVIPGMEGLGVRFAIGCKPGRRRHPEDARALVAGIGIFCGRGHGGRNGFIPGDPFGPAHHDDGAAVRRRGLWRQ